MKETSNERCLFDMPRELFCDIFVSMLNKNFERKNEERSEHFSRIQQHFQL